MDEAERRFRVCAARFKRDLTKIILRSIDGAVRETLKEASKQAKAAARDQLQSSKSTAKSGSRKRQNEASGNPGSRGSTSLRPQNAANANESEDASGTQVELRLDLASIRSAKAGSPRRVRADSILGAELAGGADTGLAAATTEPVPGLSSSAKQPSERPLFVHRRARDGQIHALRRAREAAGQAASEGTVGSGTADHR